MKLPKQFSGEVIHGFGRGSTKLGFPTANIDPKSWDEKVNPNEYGVYCGLVRVRHDPNRFCVFSIGKNPTFQTEEPTFEVHILDFNDDIYGEIITVEVLAYIRPMITFNSIGDLIKQITTDCQTARDTLSQMINS
ncbi:Riboflavin kinase / FAD synthetase family protein [Trichomonas vaginalis G3]|uniref:riboflavin kinase n=1 Tax=Trichomonas vaginalis (strain ATCC PRA-98 / G3) TaxID=412133 RepID=A2G7J2_TRIV3|nr:riboflavin kinase protein [Trichomonas vaginalis G3]EAX86882.1 Riboflavin kinase / FAD synthetase family protein [Trichomonas vaginalis G3]KAI5500858.1 riboflavin kinase protein [Trichomonas vaginalis G3]|eukprot:XP_001299812.1 Riboflavin kinase / FAD synthetase family protein [Trichomonas vaginalis G3]